MEPSSNWGLIGHSWAVDLLKKHIANDAVRHAYLIIGPAGIGRRTLALRFSQALNCEDVPATGEFCGVCRSCRQIESMQHPDLSVVQADAEGGILKIDQVREVTRNLSFKPYFSPRRIALFVRFHEANPNAQNALLKTLEEAPDFAVLILTADNAEQLLPTIVSRCEIIRLRPLSVEQVESALSLQTEDKEKARLLAHISNGRPGVALRLLTENSALEIRSKYLQALWELIKFTRRERFRYAEKLSKDKESARQALLVWSAGWRDIMLRAAKPDIKLVNLDCETEIMRVADTLSFSETSVIVSALETALEQLERNVNTRLLVENLLLSWPRIR